MNDKNKIAYFDEAELPSTKGIYLLQMDDYGYVKIGRSDNMKKRSRTICYGMPIATWPIAFIKDMTYREEDILHKRFVDDRVRQSLPRSEWFFPSEKLVDFLNFIIYSSPTKEEIFPSITYWPSL